jgi:ankyrin repeat protein
MLLDLASECVVFIDMERRTRASKKLAHDFFFRKLFTQECFQRSRHAVWSEMKKMADGSPQPCADTLLQACQIWPLSTTWEEYGMLPLHFALQNSSIFGDDVVHMLLRINPQAAFRENMNGVLPLMLAVRSCAPLPTIQALLTLNPAAACCSTRAGFNPLHYVSNGLDEETTALMCEASASASVAREKGATMCLLSPTIPSSGKEGGSLPIHLALRSKRSKCSSISILMEAEPEALEMSDEDGNLPLHLIVKCLTNFWDLLEPTLQLHPEGGMVINVANQSPLTIILRWIFDMTILTNHRNKAEILTKLHTATAAVEMLIQRCPECVKIINKKTGEYPLHLALRCQASPKVVQMLVDAHPAVARKCMANYRGNTPLHVACQTNGKGRVVEQLVKLEGSSKAASLRNRKGY